MAWNQAGNSLTSDILFTPLQLTFELHLRRSVFGADENADDASVTPTRRRLHQGDRRPQNSQWPFSFIMITSTTCVPSVVVRSTSTIAWSLCPITRWT